MVWKTRGGTRGKIWELRPIYTGGGLVAAVNPAPLSYRSLAPAAVLRAESIQCSRDYHSWWQKTLGARQVVDGGDHDGNFGQ